MSAVAARQQQQSLQLNINGQLYTVALQENARFDNITSTANHVHYLGKLVGEEQSWLRISKINGHWQGIVSLWHELHLIDSSQIESISAPVLVSKDITTSVIRNMDDEQVVSTEHIQPVISTAAKSTPFANLCANTVNDVCLIADVEVAFDQQWQQAITAIGEDPEAQAASLMNIVEGFYLNDFGISFNILNLALLDSTVFTESENAEDLLGDIIRKRQSNQLSFERSEFSVFHLVTGRDFAKGSGIARSKSVCSNGGASGTTRITKSAGVPSIALSALVVAHEIGHNFGAAHDGSGNSCDDTFLMGSAVKNRATGFSSCSKSSIENYIGNIDSLTACMSFPADISITAAVDNPVEAPQGEVTTLAYQVQVNHAYQAVSSVMVSGAVSVDEGQFHAVTLNDLACSVADNGLSYQCIHNQAQPNMLLLVDFAIDNALISEAAHINQSAMIHNQNDIVDIDSRNDQLTSQLRVLETDTSTSANNDSSSTTSSANNNNATSASQSNIQESSGGSTHWLWLISLVLIRLYQQAMSIRFLR
ncbi:MAG: M12 family metallo-peptidase [Colwellia sp.]|nr:M12 family metallo-peptidase [Colwellia sp.]MCW8863496.1 M12 family metallo-peptidase [Colwellia sp.]MCW9079930.1 M12 family metallo-peptidase [Colwellia sp.]